MHDVSAFLGIDMGGTRTRLARYHDGAGAWQPVDAFATLPEPGAQVARIVQAAAGAAYSHIGLAIGVQLSGDGDAVAASYTLPAYVGYPFVAALRARLDAPLRAANDNVCAALAETRSGALAGAMRGAYLTVSTGTGAGVRLGGIDGVPGVAYFAQAGHQSIDPHGPRCTCGQVGCVQTITGAASIRARYGVDAHDLHDDAAWDAITQAVATAAVNLARLTRLDALCIGGGIGLNSAYLRAHLPARVRALGPALDFAFGWARHGEAAPLAGTRELWADDRAVTVLH